VEAATTAPSMSLLNIPGIMSGNPDAFVNALFMAAARGVRIFISAAALEKLRSVLDELGVKYVRADTLPSKGSYIFIDAKDSDDESRIYIAIHDNNTVRTRTFKLSVFIAALKRMKQKLNISSPAETTTYELLLPEDIKNKLLQLGEK